MCVPGTVEIVRARMAEVEAPAPPVRLTRRTALLAAAGAAAAAAMPRAAIPAASRGGTRMADLTHVYSEDFPSFADPPIFPATERTTHVTVPANGFYGQVWKFWEHTCTHMDVPAHFIASGRTSPQLRLDELLQVPIVVVDISERAATEHDTVVTPDDLARFERRNGRIPRGAIVAMYSGWETRAGSKAAYRNPDASGVMRFPGFGKPAVDWLLANRGITGIGVDTLSLDHGSSATFDTHLTLLSADRYGIENLKNLSTIPARGARAFVGLIPWREGSGGPARIIASW
jgi:kynurenine formamidase